MHSILNLCNFLNCCCRQCLWLPVWELDSGCWAAKNLVDELVGNSTTLVRFCKTEMNFLLTCCMKSLAPRHSILLKSAFWYHQIVPLASRRDMLSYELLRRRIMLAPGGIRTQDLLVSRHVLYGCAETAVLLNKLLMLLLIELSRLTVWRPLFHHFKSFNGPTFRKRKKNLVQASVLVETKKFEVILPKNLLFFSMHFKILLLQKDFSPPFNFFCKKIIKKTLKQWGLKMVMLEGGHTKLFLTACS